MVMDTPQKRALQKYRKRLGKRGLARFEVLGLEGDRDLIRSLASVLILKFAALRLGFGRRVVHAEALDGSQNVVG
jgi:hypothetical protein